MPAVRAAVAIGALIAAGAFAIAYAGPARSGELAAVTTITAPPGTPAWLIDEAQRQATSFDDSHPSSIAVFLGANYKLVLRGHFTCGACSRPPGATSPKGEVVVVVFDGHLHHVGAFSIIRAEVYDRTIAYGHGRILTARRSNRLFSIFPSRIETAPCRIVRADASQPTLAATCATQLRKFRDGRARVTFEQTWAGGSRAHRWIVVVSAEGKAGPATSAGDPAPQLAPGEKTN